MDVRYDIGGWEWLFIMRVHQFKEIYGLLTLHSEGATTVDYGLISPMLVREYLYKSAPPQTHRARLRCLAS